MKQLTKRELEVLQLVGNGFTNREIALKLNITEKCVEKHVSKIFYKLDVNNRIKAVNTALSEGLIMPSQGSNHKD